LGIPQEEVGEVPFHYGVDRLVRGIGVGTWVSDRLFPRYFFACLSTRWTI